MSDPIPIVYGDWRDVRAAIEGARAKLGMPRFDALTNEDRKPIWDFAEALLASYAPLHPHCTNCRRQIAWAIAYRCADCNTVYCETCVRPHFGPNHKAHA